MLTYYLLPFNLSQFRQDLSEGKKVALCDELLEMVKGNMKEVRLYKFTIDDSELYYYRHEL